jgi:hypothetical protein
MQTAAFIGAIKQTDEQDYVNLKKRLAELNLPPLEFEKASKMIVEALKI